MGKITEKLTDWKNRLKDRHMLSVIVVLFAIIIAMGMLVDNAIVVSEKCIRKSI